MAAAWPLLGVGALCAAIMGYAIQRGATCLVAAMAEVVERRRGHRLLAIGEAAVIVSGGLAIARVAGAMGHDPVAAAVTGWTLLGGVLLGLGAVVAGACVFGAIARLGSGAWAYLAVPPGFFLGALLGGGHAGPALMTVQPPAFAMALLLPAVAVAAWRLAALAGAVRAGMLARHIWSPHVATAIIGLTFLILFLTAGPWSYTDALAEAARGMTTMTGARLLLLLCLLGGAMLGGWTAGRLRWEAPTLAAVTRCLAGGVLMGAGSVLIPGGNDGLILIGLPLLQPQALVALPVMALTIGLCLHRRAMAMAGGMT